jgi:serine phosphatase RsbU (regulator of sigma subunit)
MERLPWIGPRSLVTNRWQRLAWGLLLAGIGVLINSRELPIWLGISIDPSLWTASAFLFGSLPAVLALLFLGGLWGVVVSAAAWSVSWILWGHPWGLFAMTGQFVWLTVVLVQRDDRDLVGTGRVIFSDLWYWVVIGVPATIVYQLFVNQFRFGNAAVIAVKYLVNELIVIALGCLIYFIIRLMGGRRTRIGLSVRGVVLMMVMSSISITGLSIALFSLKNLEDAVQVGLEQRLVLLRDTIAAYTPADLDSWGPEDQRTIGDAAFYRVDRDGSSWTSNPGLLQLLRSDYRSLPTSLDAKGGFYVLTPKTESVRNRRWEMAYILYDYPESDGESLAQLPYYAPIKTLKVAVPAEPLVTRVEYYGLSTLVLLAVMVAVAVLVSDLAANRFSREFEVVLVPVLEGENGDPEGLGSAKALKSAGPGVAGLGMRPLDSSPIKELDVMVDALNGKIRQVNELAADLHATNEELEQSRERIAALLAIADQQMQTAKQIQQYFLAEGPGESDGFELAYYLQPAYQVGADWYDLLCVDQKQFLVVADVCDKGVGSALFMSVFRSLLRYSLISEFSGGVTEGEQASVGDRLAHVTAIVNRYMAENHGASSMFATVFLAAYEPEKHFLHYVCAGHETPFVRRSSGVETLQVTGSAIGIFSAARFSSGSTQLSPGDVLVAYTDGLPDARSAEGKALGAAAVMALLEEPDAEARSAQDWLDRLTELAFAHIDNEEQFDDLTLLVLKILA